MSSGRGYGFCGRGRDNSPQAQPSVRGGRSSRKRGLVNNSNGATSSFAGPTPTKGTFGRTPAGSSNHTGRGRESTIPTGPSGSRAPARGGASSVAKSRGSWQDRWQSLTAAREQERHDAIQRGLIADPDKPRALADAITPTGTCQDMCAEYERVQRVVQKDVWDEERDPNHSPFAQTEAPPDEARFVKKFRRAAAGLEEQLPSDLRPPVVLRKTCDYLFNDVVASASSLAQVHHFVWDRTRAIRNDFSIQSVTRPDELRIAVDCYERIARFHIVSLHQLALPEKPYSRYDWQQEREQLDRTLLSLMQLYDDSRGRIELPNEPEFRAYCVIFQLQDPIPDLEDRIQSWPRHVLRDARVRKAMEIYMAACNVHDSQGPLKPRASHLIARQDWQRFWVLVASKEVSYLMACAAEIYFNLVRRTVLSALFKTARMKESMPTPEWTIDVLCDLLAFDDSEQVYEYCSKFGFSFEQRDQDGQTYLDLTSVKGRTLPEPAAGIPKQRKTRLVEDKRYGRTIPAIVDGLSVQQALDAGLVIEEEDEGMEGVAAAKVNGEKEAENADDVESLFIPEDKGPDQAQQHGTANTTTNTPSPFGFGSNGTFGKPSSSTPLIATGETSTFGKPSAPSTTALSGTVESSSFGKPSTSAPSTTNGTFAGTSFGQPSAPQTSSANPFGGSSFGKPSTPSIFSPSPTTSPAPPKFDFLRPASPAAAKEEKKPAFDFLRPASPAAASSTGNSPVFDFLSGSKNQENSQQDGEKPSIAPAQPTTAGIAPSSSAQPGTSPFGTGTFSFAGTHSPSTQQPAVSAPGTSSQTSLLPQQPHPAAAPAAPAPTPRPASPNQPAEPKAQQHHFIPPPTSHAATSTPPALHSTLPPPGHGLRRSPSISDNRPKKPSPLVHSITASDENTTPEPTAPPPVPTLRRATTPVISEAEELAANTARVADEFFNAPVAGVLDQYIRYHVSHTINEVKDELETERDNKIADEFRHCNLLNRYGKLWRTIFTHQRIVKSGRERRLRRQRRLQERNSTEPDNFSALGSQSLGSSRASSVVRGIEPSRAHTSMGSSISKALPLTCLTAPVTEKQAVAGSKRPSSSHANDNHNGTQFFGHKRFKSTSHVDERGRIAKPTKPTDQSQAHADLLRRSAFLAFSAERTPPPKNTTTSNYFRLKAMGLHRVESDLRGTKRRASSASQAVSQTSPPALRTPSSLGESATGSVAKALMPPPTTTLSRTSKVHDKDEALFARLRAAREKLNETTAFYKSEVGNEDERRRSLGASQSSDEYDSPSMAKARADAKLRASLLSNDGSTSASTDVPAYRLRESKFVPKDSYVRAIERAKEIRESRSREASRPESRNSLLGSTYRSAEAGPSKALFSTSNNVPHGLPVSKVNGTAPAVATVSQSPSQSQTTPFANNFQSAFGSSMPFDFANHTTQLSNENPFLQAEPSGLSQAASFPPKQHKEWKPTQTSVKDQTIQPSQINQALSNSFGSSHGHGQNHQFSMSSNQPFESQQNSYLATQTIDLLSDNGDDHNETMDSTAQLNGNHQQEAAQELLDVSTQDATEDEGQQGGLDEEDVDGLEYEEPAQSYAYPCGHANRYAALDFEDEESKRSSDNEAEYDQERNGYAATDDEDDGAEGDDEDEMLDQGSEEEGFEEEDDEEDGYGYEDEDAEYYQDDRLATTNGLWAQSPNTGTPGPTSAKVAALQAAGANAEEAIELSD